MRRGYITPARRLLYPVTEDELNRIEHHISKCAIGDGPSNAIVTRLISYIRDEWDAKVSVEEEIKRLHSEIDSILSDTDTDYPEVE